MVLTQDLKFEMINQMKADDMSGQQRGVKPGRKCARSGICAGFEHRYEENFGAEVHILDLAELQERSPTVIHLKS